MKKLVEKYLLTSGYDKFINSNDFYLIAFDKVHNKSYFEIDELGHFFLLIQGNMDVYFPDKNGKNHLLVRIYADDYQLGGVSKYLKKKYNSMDNYLISLNNGAVCYGINKGKIGELFNSSSFMEFIFEKYMNFASRTMQENYLRNVFSIEEYLAYILYNHAREGIYDVISYSHFANLLKCDRTTLYRVIIALETRGILEKNEKILKIKSMEKLKFIFDEKL